jgi:hypothetical protein
LSLLDKHVNLELLEGLQSHVLITACERDGHCYQYPPGQFSHDQDEQKSLNP